MSTSPTEDSPMISSRKDDHLDLCAQDEVEYRRKTTLLEEVELLHDSLPEVHLDHIDMSVEMMGRTLRAPLLITGMTGGAERAQSINRELARVAEELGLAFGVGSQRAMWRHPSLADTYKVRDVAPNALIFGNIGLVQAAEMSTQEVEDLAGTIDADAICLHLNPAQELVQPDEGDRDFRGCVEAIERLCDALSIPVIAKETGCGTSPRALDKLARAGVRWVDVSGAGGTTWVGVETLRTPPSQRDVGELLWEWGVPTAPAIAWASTRGLRVIGSGGLRSGMDVARAIALGAEIAGMALPWLRAVHNEGAEAALAYGQRLIHSLRVIMALTGSENVAALRHAPRVLGPNLQRWIDQG